MTAITAQKTIEASARARIDLYLALPIGAHPSCPYFNNRRQKIKSGLRVLRGKGTPEEIAEECQIDALHLKLDVVSATADKLKEFLVDRSLGVDCSGFAYHVLSAALSERKKKSLPSEIKTKREGFLGRLAARLRPAENVGVATLADERNSFAIKASEAIPGDIITFIGTGADKLYNHVLVITTVDESEDGLRIGYAHSYAWPSDGKFAHGVREGNIIVHGNDLLGGTWKEQDKIGGDNYTYTSAKDAKEVTVRRLNCMA